MRTVNVRPPQQPSIESRCYEDAGRQSPDISRLHTRQGAFIIPNPWDLGTAKLLISLGYEALATTSAGFAFSQGQPDNSVGRAKMIDHVRSVVGATDVPVSADLENGYGDAPEDVAFTIREAFAAGVVGASIEDSTQDSLSPIYDHVLAAERVSAASEAARTSSANFMLTARCENFLVGRPDIADTIRRLQAYQQAGADVLFAPGINDKNDISALIRSVDRPVNVVWAGQVER